jgi:hypothetical protein
MDSFNANVRVFQKSTRWVAVVTLQTPRGPVTLAASADEALIAQLYKMGMGMARNAAKKMATKMVMAKVVQAKQLVPSAVFVPTPASSLPTSAPIVPPVSAPAANLYRRLLAKDPAAQESLKTLLSLASSGDYNAGSAVSQLRSLHRVTTSGSSADSLTCAGYSAADGYANPIQTVTSLGIRNLVALARLGDPQAAMALQAFKTPAASTRLAGLPAGLYADPYYSQASSPGYRSPAYHPTGTGALPYTHESMRGRQVAQRPRMNGVVFSDSYPAPIPGYFEKQHHTVPGFYEQNAGRPRTGYYPFPSENRAGVSFTGAIRQLTPARTNQLLAMMQDARLAPRPLLLNR